MPDKGWKQTTDPLGFCAFASTANYSTRKLENSMGVTLSNLPISFHPAAHTPRAREGNEECTDALPMSAEFSLLCLAIPLHNSELVGTSP